MSPLPDEEGPESTGPPDRQTLRLLERTLVDEPIVDATAFDPDAYEPQLLRAHFDESQYPPSIATARLNVRWFTSGDFSIHYIETTRDEEHWECRWDRHPNAHDARLHFHRPPDGTEIEALSLSSLHPIDVASTVIAAVERRIARRWSSDED